MKIHVSPLSSSFFLFFSGTCAYVMHSTNLRWVALGLHPFHASLKVLNLTILVWHLFKRWTIVAMAQPKDSLADTLSLACFYQVKDRWILSFCYTTLLWCVSCYQLMHDATFSAYVIKRVWDVVSTSIWPKHFDWNSRFLFLPLPWTL